MDLKETDGGGTVREDSPPGPWNPQPEQSPNDDPENLDGSERPSNWFSRNHYIILAALIVIAPVITIVVGLLRHNCEDVRLVISDLGTYPAIVEAVGLPMEASTFVCDISGRSPSRNLSFSVIGPNGTASIQSSSRDSLKGRFVQSIHVILRDRREFEAQRKEANGQMTWYRIGECNKE